MTPFDNNARPHYDHPERGRIRAGDWIQIYRERTYLWAPVVQVANGCSRTVYGWLGDSDILAVQPMNPTPQWLPIETAPRDGTEIWAYGEGECFTAEWDHEGHWCSVLGLKPTHWMPLPAGPEGEVTP